MSRPIALLLLACAAASCGPGYDAHRISREGFLSAVKGKTPEEVFAAVGNPDRNSREGPRDMSFEWTYLNRTYDTETGETDARTAVRFRGAETGPDGKQIVRASGITFREDN